MTVLCPYESEEMPSEQPEIKLPPPRVYKYAITLSDSDFKTLSNRNQHLTFCCQLVPESRRK